MLNVLKYLRSRKTIDAKVEISQKDDLLVVFNRKRLVLGKGILKYPRDHGSPLMISPAPANQMAVYEHDGLVVDLESHADSALVSCCAQSSSLDSAQLKRFRLEPTG